ncbi:TPA: hypothetical protein DIC20_03545 [Candidatus Dependentiae bacterium]|nr:MAG: Type IV pilus assembly protein PilM [candidate division TM6 bacterium GW2011_GWF2_36_131]KKQ03768.1 MAG: Type IV pilus assembly protein PilM [candidate division TM6 bacterium GW2011_GWE2_36_25]KKQ19913.1 MAG: Type IV pilus assembly protein PilM [candidate division TM6 bacterium GW2011_GWA2_36_9]HBR70534.1 hypothetical protein [Candidatus Dependentiae bacterium]HCU00750.1 hypothetical protein [Candidatus Dependentiae bacterium]
MIKNIFLPERIGNHFIFSENYLGLEITKSTLIGTKINVSGTRATLLDFYHEPITKSENEENEQTLIKSLQNLLKAAGKSSQIKLTLPNNIAIFKELTLPFIDEEQIRQILPFKLEAHIPFPINTIAFDFVKTKVNQEKKESTILVGIVQKKNLESYLIPLKKTPVLLSSVTIDLFSLYGLYRVHPEYSRLNESVGIIDIGFQSSTIAYINNQQLLTSRSINVGLNTLAKNIATKTKKTIEDILEQLVRFGIAQTDDSVYNKALEQEIHNIYSQIQFTLNAFSAQMPTYEPIKRFILITRGTQIKEFDKKLEQLFTLPVEYFNTHALLNIASLKTKSHISSIPLINILSFGAAYPFSPTSSFDLLQSQEIEQEKTKLEHQLVVTFVLIILFLGTLIGFGIFQRTQLRKKINNAKRSALNQLRSEIDVTDSNLTTAVANAKTKLSDTEAIWAGFSESSRYSPLKYLAELSTKIDRPGIGLDLKKLVLTKKSISLIGQVRDYPALKTLEEELTDSKLFKLVTTPQDFKLFTIKLAITAEEEEAYE